MQPLRTARGFTLARLMAAIALLGIALTGSISGVRSLASRSELVGAARVVRGQLAYARTLAVARRERIRLTLSPQGDLVLFDSRDSLVRRVRLLGPEGFRIDSVRLRPEVIRFNSRGQAAPGSVYLHDGAFGVRLVMNFVGRIRQERLP